MMTYKKVLSFIKSQSELLETVEKINSHVKTTAKECFLTFADSNLYEIDLIIFKIDSVLDYLHDELNTGHWSEVPLTTRRAFTICTYIKTISILKRNNEESLKEALKCTDLGLLLGAPLVDNFNLLSQTASFLTEELNISNTKDNVHTGSLKRRLSENHEQYDNIIGKEIVTVVCPSIEKFNRDFYEPQIPVKLKDCINHWPAMTKWNDINYLLKVAGNRTVPVEVGSHYADENWSQKLMLLKDFIGNYFLKERPDNLAYLAQHNLFDQITELRKDIYVPEYCCLSKNEEESCDADINAWFGPKDTVSPLHYDPKDNLLAQVFGTKQIILFSPNDSECVYAHEDKLLSNTARVDPLKPNYEEFPKFKNAVLYKCLLGPGEILYIPEKWWHHVTALEKSFSVSFWWK